MTFAIKLPNHVTGCPSTRGLKVLLGMSHTSTQYYDKLAVAHSFARDRFSLKRLTGVSLYQNSSKLVQRFRRESITNKRIRKLNFTFTTGHNVLPQCCQLGYVPWMTWQVVVVVIPPYTGWIFKVCLWSHLCLWGHTSFRYSSYFEEYRKLHHWIYE